MVVSPHAAAEPEPAAVRDQLRELRVGVERADLTPEQLWLRYFALGGVAGPVEVEAHLSGLMVLSALQGDMLAQAVNECLDDLLWTSRVPYLRTVSDDKLGTGPLAALGELLDSGRRTPPDGIPAAAAAAGRALGVRVGMYLVDYAQRWLVPLPTPDSPGSEPLAVDGTWAGQAFRAGETLPLSGDGDGDGDISGGASDDHGGGYMGGGAPRLWVPLVDGADRLGVLEVTVPEAADLYDPAMREQCRWLSTALGHLVAAAADHGDALEVPRRRLQCSPAAELIRSLLPPLTASTEEAVLAGMLEPGSSGGSDVFDYALSETMVQFAIFDATGAPSGAGLIAAIALAAYRVARREGRDLVGQIQAIEKAVIAGFGTSASVTCILGELDLTTGHLRYLAAGDPGPRLLRGGKVVEMTAGGRRPPLGVDVGPTWEFRPAQEALSPGDWLVFYTDGVSSVRNDVGEVFGEERLTDILQRESAADQPAPEAVRRLIQAVVDFHNGALVDDATVLIARWTPASTAGISPAQ